MPYPLFMSQCRDRLRPELGQGLEVALAWATGFYPSGSFPCWRYERRRLSISSHGEGQPCKPPTSSLPFPTPSPLLPSESTFPPLPLEGPGTGGFVGSCSYTNLRQEAHFQFLSKASPRPHSNCLLGLLQTRGQRPEPGEATSLAAGKAG